MYLGNEQYQGCIFGRFRMSSKSGSNFENKNKNGFGPESYIKLARLQK
jgi:hypothetical protein